MNKEKNHGMFVSKKNRLVLADAHRKPPILRETHQAGFTLLELLICLAIASILILGLSDILTTTLATRRLVHAENDLALQAEFAMDRIHRTVHGSSRLLIPLGENQATAWNESVRDVLAVTLGPVFDLDNNGIPDADNDGDGLIDEDLPADNFNNNVSGISNIDDDGDGQVDESSIEDDDEDEDSTGNRDEDPVNGMDDDGDGSIDEDIPADMNADSGPGIAGIDDDNDNLTDESSAEDDDEDEDSSGNKDEDWLDAVVYFLVGTTLMERLPVPWDENNDGQVTGMDYVESPLAENVKRFEVSRQDLSSGKTVLVTIILELTGDEGKTYSLTATLRIGGSA